MREPLKTLESASLAAAMNNYLRQGGLISRLDHAGNVVELASEPVPPPAASTCSRCGAVGLHACTGRTLPPAADEGRLRAALLTVAAAERTTADLIDELRAIRAEADALLAQLPTPRSFQ